ncbi:hypothetical protein Pmar_PMAR025058, partial [Perkinsus marinus ATCC 50983]
TAAFELLNHQHIPTTVVINEANSLAKEFCPRSQTLVHASVNRMIETQYSVGHQLREAMVAGDMRNSSKPSSSPTETPGSSTTNPVTAQQLNNMDPATQLALLLIEKERKKKERRDRKRKHRRRHHRNRSRSRSSRSRSSSTSSDSRGRSPSRPTNFANMVPPTHPDYRPARIEYQPIDPSQHVLPPTASPSPLSSSGTSSVLSGGGGIVNPPHRGADAPEEIVDPSDFVKAGQRAAAMLMTQGMGARPKPIVSGPIKTIPQRRVELCNAECQTTARPDLDKDAVIWRLRPRSVA